MHTFFSTTYSMQTGTFNSVIRQNDLIKILDNVHSISQLVLLSQYGHILQTRVLLSKACVLFPVYFSNEVSYNFLFHMFKQKHCYNTKIRWTPRRIRHSDNTLFIVFSFLFIISEMFFINGTQIHLQWKQKPRY